MAVVAALASLGVALGGCQQSGSDSLSSSNVPPPPQTFVSTVTAATPLAAPLPHYFPPVPPVLPKPRCLGPVDPAIMVIPTTIAEPWIRVRLTPALAYVPKINAANYRGRIEIDRLADGKFVAINVVPIESYLAGVLSKELYPSWSPTAYRAQAVAARTYALYQIATTPRNRAWNVTGTVASQMYGGKRGESTTAWNAVLATKGLVMETTEYGRTGIFCAFYSACNGGASQSPYDAWGDAPVQTLPEKVTGNIDSACPKFRWPPMRIGKWTITDAVRRWGARNGLPYLADLGLVRNVFISHYNRATGRPTEITFTDIHGHSGTMRAEEFRLALLTDPAPGIPKPPSSFFRIENDGNFIVLTHGRGFGHGIGLSQWGDEALAQRGYSAAQILNYYYPKSFIHREW